MSLNTACELLAVQLKQVLHDGHERGHDQSALFSPESLSFASNFGHDAALI